MKKNLFHSAGATLAMAAALAGVGMAGDAAAQDPSPRQRVLNMKLASETIGGVTAHFAPEDRARAHELAGLVDGASKMYGKELGLKFRTEIAVLQPKDWFADIPGIPYAVPWASIQEHLLLLPSSVTQGVVVEGRPPFAARRLLDLIALHEYGHVLEKELYRPGDANDYSPVAWFRELLANCFAYAYVARTDPAWAADARRAWRAEAGSWTPEIVSLDWTFMNSMTGRELSRVYGWYQLTLDLRAAELYDEYGMELFTRLRALPWRTAQEWTRDSLEDSLREVVPSLADWAESFGAKQPASVPGQTIPTIP